MKKSLNILIIDDSKDDLEFYSRLLERGQSKHNVYIAEDYSEGLKIVEDTPLDCALVDYSMPHKNGLEVLDLINSMTNRELAVILISGQPNKNILAEAKENGVIDYIVKDMTLTSDILEATIFKCIEKFKKNNLTD